MTLLVQPTSNFWVSPVADRENSLRFQKTIFSRKSILSSASASLVSKVGTFALAAKTIDTVTTDYDTKIRHFCDVGNLKKAVELLHVSPKSELDLMTYCMVLQLCAERKSLNEGRKVHSVLISNGVEISGILGTKLVFMYVSCGDLKQGRELFDVLANEKVFLWNLMMNEYAKIGDFNNVVELFNKMRALNVDPNSHTFTSVLKLLGSLKSEDGGEAVHACAMKMGLSSHNNVANALITFYFKVGRFLSAFKVFDELSDRDVVSWNSMISGCVSNGAAVKGLELFQEMLEAGIDVDFATLINVLVACTDCGVLLLGRAVHSYVVKSGPDVLMFGNVLIDMYSKCGDLISASRVFDKMSSKNAVSWTSMMAGFTRAGLSDKAISLFRQMETEGPKPDVYTITSVLHACSLYGSLENGQYLHEYVRKNGFDSSLSVCNSLIDMYAKCGSMEEAKKVFNQLGIRKNIVSWNALIGGYTKNGLSNDPVNMFTEMQRLLKPDGFTLACVLPAADLRKGLQIHGYILRSWFWPDQHVANALLDMYVKCGALVLARSVFKSIIVKNLVSWTVMVAGFAMHGFGRESIETFNQMRKTGIEPNEVSFMATLSACSHSGLLDEGYRFFNIMRYDCNIEAKLEHYGCVVEMLSRAGKLSEAYKFIKSMPVEPDAKIWSELLCGCRVHHDVNLAEKVAEEVFTLEPENTEYYMLLANVYAEAERWEEARKLTERISRIGSKKKNLKNTGCSWIEVRGKVEIFVSGDYMHPQMTKIDKLLTELRSLMKEHGKYLKTKYALIDEDETGKDGAICRHSEQLAMAFGVLNLPPGKTIRVVKDVRVCRECHEMAKFMSKVTEREIILRDSNRFHHFRDGNCSCKGYW
ncbi:unnamed protein product [Rhodiola kirilowii]